MTTAGGPTFKDLERAGWTKRAAAYDDWFANITRQAIDPLLGALGTGYASKAFLDICTGTGHLAKAAAERGARVEGIDFADAMVSRARANYPMISFRQADAEALPYDDASFDIVACSFGLLHFENADKALAEARRVLRTGGRYGFTVWCGPDRGGEFFDVVFGAVQEHGTFDVDLPPAPPLFRFADPAESDRALRRCGFTDVTFDVLSLTWRPASEADILAMIYKSVVRMPMILERQTQDARERIERAIVEGAAAYRRGDRIEFAYPAAMVTATKA